MAVLHIFITWKNCFPSGLIIFIDTSAPFIPHVWTPGSTLSLVSSCRLSIWWFIMHHKDMLENFPVWSVQCVYLAIHTHITNPHPPIQLPLPNLAPLSPLPPSPPPPPPHTHIHTPQVGAVKWPSVITRLTAHGMYWPCVWYDDLQVLRISLPRVCDLDALLCEIIWTWRAVS